MTAGRMWIVVVGVVLLLLASLAWSGLQVARHMAGQTSIQPVSVAAPPVRDAQRPPQDLAAITALAPFGQPVPDQRPADPGATRASLDLALRGVLVDPDPASSRAFIRTGGGVGVYRIGEEVQSAELVAVGTDTITVRLGEELVIVGFEGVQDGPATDATTDAEPAPRDDPFARLAAAIVPGKGSIDLRDPPPPETTEEYIAFWRDRITRNPQAAMDSVGVELVENGYRIKPDPNIGVTLAGLRPGDVITRLNGQSVGDLEKDRILYDDVAAAGIARVEVVREGQTMLLTFPLR